ncbi:MAG: NAD(P)/FAD-dependent oxidoreductase [Candidatus Pacebacteria bacterium]|nr:NAD(P)/FAD-dependent oxidoreductase [Candidatus Paceibacterota bacterium]
MQSQGQKSITSSIETEFSRDTLWDLIVIGGGPSGMMAAGRAAELGSHVLILEKNESLGKKLLITGGGRCNVTNSEFDTRVLLAKFKDGGKFLFSPFSQYGVKETLDFFHRNGMDTKVENEKRTFPVSDNAGSVLEVLKKYMQSGHVVIQSNAEVSGFVLSQKMDSDKVTENGASNKTSDSAPKTITGVKIKGDDTVFGKKFVLATGGKSRPETGSTGDGFAWAKQLGHTVVEPSASLVPLKAKDVWIKNLAGITLGEVKITILQNGVRQNKPVKGKILFTHVGVSGPTVLNLSKDVGELLKYGDVFISVDVLPNIDQATLDTKLNTLFRTEINKKLKNCLGLIGGAHETDNSPLLPTALIKSVIEISGVDGETPAHSVTKEDRRKILATLKGLTIQISGLLGTDKAIVTSGGVVLTEIEPKTMQSRIHPNLYLVGDMLNIDRPSGGYSLQLCWTTGYVAGNDAGSNVGK